MKKYRVITLMGLLAFSVISKADITRANITNIATDSSNSDNFVAVELDRNIVNGVCQRNNVLMVDLTKPSNKGLLAAAMMAKTNGQAVWIRDSGTCPHLFNGQSVGEVSLFKG